MHDNRYVDILGALRVSSADATSLAPLEQQTFSRMEPEYQIGRVRPVNLLSQNSSLVITQTEYL